MIQTETWDINRILSGSITPETDDAAQPEPEDVLKRTSDGFHRRHGGFSRPPPWPLTPDPIWASSSLHQLLFRIPGGLIRRWPCSRCRLSTFHSLRFRRRPPSTADGEGERSRGHRAALRKRLVWPQRKTSCSQQAHEQQQIVSTDRSPSGTGRRQTPVHTNRRTNICLDLKDPRAEISWSASN